MPFNFSGYFNSDGDWRFIPDVPDGNTVHGAEVVRLLSNALAFYSDKPHARLATRAERAAINAREEEARSLPENWAATLDGVNTALAVETGLSANSRTYRRADFDPEANVSAPCDAAGNPTPETRATLLAYDASCPFLPPGPGDQAEA